MAVTRPRGGTERHRSTPAFDRDFEAYEDAGAHRMVPHVGVLEALRRHWFVAIVPLLAILGAAVALGLTRRPVYTAKVSLSVGKLAVTNVAAIPGLVDASRALASNYSRAIYGTAVSKDAARRLRTTPAEVVAHVSATPVPDSNLFRVTGTASTAANAVAYANVTSSSLVAYLRRLSATAAGDNGVFVRFQRVALTYSRRREEEQTLKRRLGPRPGPSDQARISHAEALTQTALLRREGLRLAYQTTQQAGTTTIPVQILAPATSATSDRNSKLQLFVFIGLLAGLASGTALAILRGNRVARRLIR
jgi:hypothetical protein